MFEDFNLDCVIGDLEMISMIICCNMMLIYKNYRVNDELRSYNHEKFDLFNGFTQHKFLAHEVVFWMF